MAAPTPTDLEVLRRLAQTPEGRLLASVFQRRLVELDKTNRRAIGEMLIRGQGRALELEEILTDLFGIGEAPAAQLVPKQRKDPTQSALARFRVNHMAVD